TTVLHAVDSHNIQALRIVLEAGANPNPQLPKGLFRSSPITAASFGGLAGMIKLLVQFGAKIDADNLEGQTALQAVAVTQNVECVAILLQYGANMDYMSSNGCTPLMTAIMHNKHAVLRVFLSNYAGPLRSSQLSPIIAQHADSTTMSILTSFQSFSLSGNGLASNYDALLCLMDYDKTLRFAFEVEPDGVRGAPKIINDFLKAYKTHLQELNLETNHLPAFGTIAPPQQDDIENVANPRSTLSDSGSTIMLPAIPAEPVGDVLPIPSNIPEQV
ncbi:hypothetical protein FQN57_003452, partial [Myotisia sp. PD_48]